MSGTDFGKFNVCKRHQHCKATASNPILTCLPTGLLQGLYPAHLQRMSITTLPYKLNTVIGHFTNNTQQLISASHNQQGPWGGCQLTGISLSHGRHLGNLGSILLCGAAIVTSILLLLKSDKKKAAVGRRSVASTILTYRDITNLMITERCNYSLLATFLSAFARSSLLEYSPSTIKLEL